MKKQRTLWSCGFNQAQAPAPADAVAVDPVLHDAAQAVAAGGDFQFPPIQDTVLPPKYVVSRSGAGVVQVTTKPSKAPKI